MISRKSAMAIAEAYTSKYSYSRSSSHGTRKEEVYRDSFYDFLYERDYEPWFCNMVKVLRSIRTLKEWLLRIHTGETFSTATPNWSWDQRQTLGQQYLKNLARDFVVWYRSSGERDTHFYKEEYDDIIRRFEIDGYIFRDDEFYQTEVEILDVEAESGLLENLYTALALSDKITTFQFLQLAEDHYVNGRWSDCIANARKFLESILLQVASKHSTVIKKAPLPEATLEKPNAVREYLEREALVEKKEREAIDKIYGLLSHTGSHPYMAEQDQARLLRQMSLTMAQFIMLRLEGAFKSA